MSRVHGNHRPPLHRPSVGSAAGTVEIDNPLKTGEVLRGLWNNTIPDPFSDCLLWLGALSYTGKAVVKLPKKVWLRPAQHVLWELTKGKVLKGQRVELTCNTSNCMNLDHMKLAGKVRAHTSKSKQRKKKDKRWKRFLQKEAERKARGFEEWRIKNNATFQEGPPPWEDEG